MDDAALPVLHEGGHSYTGRPRIILTICYFGSFFGIGIFLAALGPCIPALARRLDVDIEGLGILFVSRAIGYVVGSLIGGLVFDRIKRTHGPLVIGNLLCAFGYALVPSLTSKTAVAFALATGGGCMGLLDTGGNDIFRMKGVLAIAHAEQKFVFHAVCRPSPRRRSLRDLPCLQRSSY